MPVTQCICSQVTFAALKKLASEKNAKSIEDLQKIRPFGLSCKLCIPYIRQMLKDGRTEFSETIIE